MTRCPTRGCHREAAPGDYLCALCRTRRVQDSRPVPQMPGGGPYDVSADRPDYNPHAIEVRGLRVEEDAE